MKKYIRNNINNINDNIFLFTSVVQWCLQCCDGIAYSIALVLHDCMQCCNGIAWMFALVLHGCVQCCNGGENVCFIMCFCNFGGDCMMACNAAMVLLDWLQWYCMIACNAAMVLLDWLQWYGGNWGIHASVMGVNLGFTVGAHFKFLINYFFLFRKYIYTIYKDEDYKH